MGVAAILEVSIRVNWMRIILIPEFTSERQVIFYLLSKMSWLFGSKQSKPTTTANEQAQEITYEPFSDEVFDKFISMCLDTSPEWNVVYEDKQREITVWTKKVPSCSPQHPMIIPFTRALIKCKL